MLRISLIIFLAVLTFILADWMLRKRTPADRLAALQKEVQAKDWLVFQTELQGKPVAFLLIGLQSLSPRRKL